MSTNGVVGSENGLGIRIQKQVARRMVDEVVMKQSRPAQKTAESIESKTLRMTPAPVPGVDAHLGRNVNVYA